MRLEFDFPEPPLVSRVAALDVKDRKQVAIHSKKITPFLQRQASCPVPLDANAAVRVRLRSEDEHGANGGLDLEPLSPQKRELLERADIESDEPIRYRISRPVTGILDGARQGLPLIIEPTGARVRDRVRPRHVGFDVEDRRPIEQVDVPHVQA